MSELIDRFLKFDVDPVVGMNPSQIDCVAAFRLLLHAEIETFLEDRSKYIVNKAIIEWKASRKVCRCLVNLVLAYHNSEKTRVAAMSLNSIDVLFEKYRQLSIKEIGDNNGIKANSFHGLTFISGVFQYELSSSLSASLESYGAARGDVAHKAIKHVRNINEPNIEIKDAKTIVDDLGRLDNVLDMCVP